MGECFFEVAEVSGLNSTTKMGGMDGFLSQRFQGKQPTYIRISDRNIGFAFLVSCCCSIKKFILSVESKKGLRSILHTVQY